MRTVLALVLFAAAAVATSNAQSKLLTRWPTRRSLLILGALSLADGNIRQLKCCMLRSTPNWTTSPRAAISQRQAWVAILAANRMSQLHSWLARDSKASYEQVQ